MNGSRGFLSSSAGVCLIAFLCCGLWGSAFPGIKIGYRLMGIWENDVAGQVLFAGLRFTLAGILTILAGSVLSRRALLPRKGSWLRIAWLSLFQTIIQYLFFYVGLAHTTGVKASVIQSANVFVAILIAGLVFRREKLDRNKILGCGAGFIGVILININSLSSLINPGSLGPGVSMAGEGSILLSTAAYGVSSVLLKIYSEADDPVMLSGWQFLTGGCILTLCGFGFGGRIGEFSAASSAILVYLAAASAVAYSLWGILLKLNPVSRVTVFGFLTPVFGVLLSAFFLGEGRQAMGPGAVAALLLVSAGIYGVNRGSGRNL